ncbi:MAG: hypothetical protein JRH20_32365, partial [Deltaproteobacteria bacterium]|nr:hypothetical protein [Deltaproteobacteria bacterium]
MMRNFEGWFWGGGSSIRVWQADTGAAEAADIPLGYATSAPTLAVVQGGSVEGARLSGHGAASDVLRGRKVYDVIGRTIGAAAGEGPAITIFGRST